MPPRTPIALVLAAALLAPATAALEDPDEPEEPSELEADGVSTEPPAPEGECTSAPDERAVTCPIPSGCLEDDRCELPSPCEPVGEEMMRCTPPEDAQVEQRSSACSEESRCEPPDDEQPPSSNHSDVGVDRGPDPPEAEAPCTPHPDEEGVVICEPPKACQGQVGDTRACTPPPFCEANGDGTYTCTPPEEGSEEAPGPPDCKPHPEQARAMLCSPPPECEGKIGETRACTPPPECEANGDGTFTCTLPENAGSEASAPERDTRRDSDPVRDRGKLPQAAEEAMEEAVRTAMEEFRNRLDELREAYQQGKEDLRATYEEKKDQLRQDYQACLEELEDDASRAERLDRERACKQDAREDLRELREGMLAERDLLREDLLGQAEDAKFQACSSLEETLHAILLDHGVTSGDLAAVLGPEELGLCSGILVGQDRTSAASSGWLEGGGAS